MQIMEQVSNFQVLIRMTFNYCIHKISLLYDPVLQGRESYEDIGCHLYQLQIK